MPLQKSSVRCLLENFCEGKAYDPGDACEDSARREKRSSQPGSHRESYFGILCEAAGLHRQAEVVILSHAVGSHRQPNFVLSEARDLLLHTCSSANRVGTKGASRTRASF